MNFCVHISAIRCVPIESTQIQDLYAIFNFLLENNGKQRKTKEFGIFPVGDGL